MTLCEEKVVNHFKFNGQQYGPISQQYYLRARYYNSVIVRFTQEDTYRGDGLNLYAYCRNNPVYYTDPSGHSCDKDATQGQSEGSDSFADQLAQHVADEIAFNQEHGLTTQYDTPQAEAANRRVEQELLYHMEGMQALETAGEVRYRQGEPVEPMEMTYEFRLNPQMYAYEVAKKYGINLRGSGQVLVDQLFMMRPHWLIQ